MYCGVHCIVCIEGSVCIAGSIALYALRGLVQCMHLGRCVCVISEHVSVQARCLT